MKTARFFALLVLLVALFANFGFAKTCSPPHSVYGLIGNKWRALGGADGPLGCPITDEMDHPEGKGRYQRFEFGEMAWSPNTGPNSVQAAYLDTNGITVEWGDTSPFNYDVFLVRWDKDGANIGQQDVSGGNRTGGKWTIPYSGLGRYRIVVEGCDRHFLSSSTCRQGWTNPVYVVYAGAPAQGTASPQAPFNLVSKTPDAMGNPLNPAWAIQLSNPGTFANADAACFDTNYGKRQADFARCTTDKTSADTVDSWHTATCYVGSTSPLLGHMNWHVATYTGRIYWLEQDWPDGDYNFLIDTPSWPGVTVANPNHLMKMEFDSDETIDNFQTPWWSRLRKAVDAEDFQTVRQMMDGKDSIVIGLVGLDCVHECGSELHPLYSIAMNVGTDPNDETWAIFVRNWGNEGWCSQYRHLFRRNDFVFHLPWRTGATAVTVLNTGSDRLFLTNNSQASGPNVTWAVNQGIDVAFHLPDPEAESRINGELHLKWTIPAKLNLKNLGTRTTMVRPDLATAAPVHAPVAAGGTQGQAARPQMLTQPAGEERLRDLFKRLPPEQRKSARASMLARPKLDNTSTKVTATSRPFLQKFSVVSMGRVDVVVDTGKAMRDQRRLRTLCAAYQDRPPGVENVCASAAKTPVIATPR